MKIMLDTNICMYLIKQRPQSLLDRFRSFPLGDIGISVITLAELQYGASKSSRPKQNREALEQFLSPLELAAFDRQATVAYGHVRAALERKGRPIGAMDLLIAAHALSLGVRVVTNDEKEFRHVPGLRVENWVSKA
ncbi:MAG: type II toxin-antitoxin system VapC family toxin [candidate division NC10 bacterium]|nr:type II toxin-antitoxin system VapC family toxin [candidate division NC10 bacterium]